MPVHVLTFSLRDLLQSPWVPQQVSAVYVEAHRPGVAHKLGHRGLVLGADVDVRDDVCFRGQLHVEVHLLLLRKAVWGEQRDDAVRSSVTSARISSWYFIYVASQVS